MGLGCRAGSGGAPISPTTNGRDTGYARRDTRMARWVSRPPSWVSRPDKRLLAFWRNLHGVERSLRSPRSLLHSMEDGGRGRWDSEAGYVEFVGEQLHLIVTALGQEFQEQGPAYGNGPQ